MFGMKRSHFLRCHERQPPVRTAMARAPGRVQVTKQRQTVSNCHSILLNVNWIYEGKEKNTHHLPLCWGLTGHVGAWLPPLLHHRYLAFQKERHIAERDKR